MLTTDDHAGSIPIHLVDEQEFEDWRATREPGVRNWLGANAFKGERSRLLLIPDAMGSAAAVVLGTGRRPIRDEQTLWLAAGLPDRLPEGHYHLSHSLSALAASQFAFGWLYGQYRFDRYKKAGPARKVVLRAPAGVDVVELERLWRACTLARDLVNTPANDMTPQALANEATALAKRYDCRHREIVGDALLDANFPAIHAVGRASVVAPRLVDIEWGDPSHRKVTLVGKGVCFDSGGLDIKPPASMLLMKKDMGGAAAVLGLAQAIMDAKLPVRLRVIVPAVENAISANAFRPGDVIGTRKGLTVEVGNTDAEGRLILCDGLALADEDKPDLLIDMATLTGAARVALGPELPALFASDDTVAADLVRTGLAEGDPLWHLPLWNGYDDELSSKIADLNNVSASGFSGAIIAALFLRRFVNDARSWVHVDLYSWNGKERPGRPVGAEAQCIRALYAYLKARYSS